MLPEPITISGEAQFMLAACMACGEMYGLPYGCGYMDAALPLSLFGIAPQTHRERSLASSCCAYSLLIPDVLILGFLILCFSDSLHRHKNMNQDFCADDLKNRLKRWVLGAF
jgi:hypothetical protein